MSVQNGDVVILQIGGVQLGALVSNSQNMTADMLDKTNKDTPGIKQFDAGEDGWGLSVEALWDPAATEGFSEALGYLKAGTEITVLHGVTGTQTFQGSGLIASIDVAGPKNEISSYSLEIQGTGVISDIPEILNDGNTMAWFDMAEAYMTKDGGDNVAQWDDRSGNDNHLIQAAAKPIWSSTGVTFDGVNDFMQCVAFTLNQPSFVYIIFKQITWTRTEWIFTGENLTGLVQYDTPSPALAAYASSYSSDEENLALDTFGIARVLFNGASSKLIINEETPVTGDFGATDMGGFTLGARATGIAPSNCQVKEVIVRRISDTAPNEAIIYNYLKNKYNL